MFRFNAMSKPKSRSKIRKESEERKSQVRARYNKDIVNKHNVRKGLVGRSSSQRKSANTTPVSLKKIPPKPVRKPNPAPAKAKDSMHTFMQGDIELDNQYNSQIK